MDDFCKFGIIGKPLGQSISPVIQAEALKSVNLKGAYEKFEIDNDEISNTIEFFKNENYKGFNVTIPYKVEIMKYLDEIDETAKHIGAVNTVKISDDKTLKGYNTDVLGFYNSVMQKRKSIKKAILFGCGGAAKAVVCGLKPAGCTDITLYGIENVNEFASEMTQKTGIKFTIKPIEEVMNFEETDIIINATPLGTKGEAEDKSVISLNNLKTLNKNALVFDVVYNPQETLLLSYAKECNLDYQNGLDMLLMQGAKAFEIWTGKEPDINKMREKALEIL